MDLGPSGPPDVWAHVAKQYFSLMVVASGNLTKMDNLFRHGDFPYLGWTTGGSWFLNSCFNEKMDCFTASPGWCPSSPYAELGKWGIRWVHITHSRNGGFLKWRYPAIINFSKIVHYKPSILGYPQSKLQKKRSPSSVPFIIRWFVVVSRFTMCAEFVSEIPLIPWFTGPAYPQLNRRSVYTNPY